MPTDKELMQQALDALESECDATKFGAANALRARLAQPEPEPVAWKVGALLYHDKLDALEYLRTSEESYPLEPLYTAPPQREWQGLTDEEIQEMWSDHCKNWQRAGKILISPTVFGNAIEAKLKEKNHG
jgi:hypothetical protein